MTSTPVAAVAASTPTSPPRRRRRDEGWLFLLLILPNLVAILLFSYWPTIYNFYLSLTDWDMLTPFPEFVGLQNYVDLFADEEFGQVLLNTLLFTVVSVMGSMVLGCALGGLLAQKIPFTGLARTLSFAPHMLPGAAVGMLWLFMFDPAYGLSRAVFDLIGQTSPSWTTTSDFSLWAVTLAYFWQRLGFVAIIYYTAILDLPKPVFEAASLDGASGPRLFWSMTLPLLAPITLFLSITGIISAAQAFDLIAVLTSGGPGISSTTLSWEIYQKAFVEFDVGRSAAAATVMFFILIILTAIQVRFANRRGN